MNAAERPATSGLVLAATLLLAPINAGASPSVVRATAPRTDTNASPDVVVPRSVSHHAPRGSASGGEHAPIEGLPDVTVTSLAAARITGQDAVLLELYRQLTVATRARGHRVLRFVLSGEDLTDSSSEDLLLEVHVESLDAEARLDLWEALSAKVEDTTSSHLLMERLALVVHGPTA